MKTRARIQVTHDSLYNSELVTLFLAYIFPITEKREPETKTEMTKEKGF